MLEEKALYFVNLKSFQEDSFEGSVTQVTIDKIKLTKGNLMKVVDLGRSLIYASCWHLNEDESAAMWRQYANWGKGIAIQSSVYRLKAALKNTEKDISIGTINYIDYKTQEIKDLNVYTWAMHKRKHFEADREVRAIFMDNGNKDGFLISINLEELIERIVVSPSSPEWFRELIHKILIRHGIDKEVRFSDI
ncbi:MAG: hypothetical protein WBE75_02075 [Candidatus Omnitrophota bacterium]